jgi:hypothetical protein
MPLLYGEGHKAFYRLQEQIIRESGDDSILAWDYIKVDDRGDDFNYENVLFAPSPGFFRNCTNVRHCRPIAWNDGLDLTNNGLRLTSHYLSSTVLADSGHGGDYPVANEAVLLNCYSEDAPGLRFALRVQQYAGSTSAERGYSICPQALGVADPEKRLQEISRGSGTRLVFIRRDREYAAIERETGLITKHFLAETSSLHLNIVLMPSDRLKFERIVRPSYWQRGVEDESIASTPEHETGDVLTKEGQNSSYWSKSFPAQHRGKVLLVGALIRDQVCNRSFMIICGHEEPSLEPRSLDDGKCGVELLERTYMPGDSSLTVERCDRALLDFYERTRGPPRHKICTSHMTGVGVTTATCSVVHAGGLTMNIKVALEPEEQQIHREAKRRRIG